jgi:EAL domain-containing protein (putative c-di-GMP-specific phosphodiesterase class I)
MLVQHHKLTEQEIIDAFDHKQFNLIYQPIVDLKTSQIVALEAFIRWKHPVLGVLPPSLFLRKISNMPQKALLPQYVNIEAIEGCKMWRKMNKHWGVHVNVSVAELRNNKTFEVLSSHLNNFSNPEDFCIEVSPNLFTAMNGQDRQYQSSGGEYKDITADERVYLDEIKTTVQKYKSLGIKIALDVTSDVQNAIQRADYVGLDAIKIKSDLIARAVFDMTKGYATYLKKCLDEATAKGLVLVPVGLENLGQLKTAMEIGFGFAQGMCLSVPMTPIRFFDWQSEYLKEAQRIMQICQNGNYKVDSSIIELEEQKKKFNFNNLNPKPKTSFGKKKIA